MYTANEKVAPANITEIMQTAYIEYSMSVIISRALPDARDGLKPVQRRILYAMLREGLLHNRAYDKCAGVVGEVLKNYHPHGDSSVYDTLVRLAQTWVMRYPLIDPQGNFGSVEGDPPAAYRYTECRLAAIAEELLSDIDEDTVDFAPNYKESTTEPTVLPAALPNLLMNGSTGIAVGMATNIPPHNLDEIITAACAVIDRPGISLDELLEIIPGPDFPTGGLIVGREGIRSYMTTGRGIVRMRGRAHTEELKNGREQIVITEIPYNVNRETLVKHIAALVTEKKLTEVSDLRNESDRNTRVVIELKRGEEAQVVINKLFQLTQLETTFGVTLLALDHRRPKQMNIKELLECYIAHRRDVITRRTQYRLRKAEERAHILEDINFRAQISDRRRVIGHQILRILHLDRCQRLGWVLCDIAQEKHGQTTRHPNRIRDLPFFQPNHGRAHIGGQIGQRQPIQHTASRCRGGLGIPFRRRRKSGCSSLFPLQLFFNLQRIIARYHNL